MQFKFLIGQTWDGAKANSTKKRLRSGMRVHIVEDAAKCNDGNNNMLYPASYWDSTLQFCTAENYNYYRFSCSLRCQSQLAYSISIFSQFNLIFLEKYISVSAIRTQRWNRSLVTDSCSRRTLTQTPETAIKFTNLHPCPNSRCNIDKLSAKIRRAATEN